MSLKQTRGAAALALVVGILGSSNSIAVLPAPVADEAQAVKPAWTPLGLSKTPVTVVVQVAGASVAEQQGAAGRRFTREEKDRAKEQLGTQHDALRPQIEAMGGQVLAHYRAAYNGLKVRIDSNRVPELAALPGVVAVRPVQLFRRQNTHGIPFIGAPTVWQNLGVHGEGVKIAIIDTGIDYTHANFGGPGTPAAYFLAQASETQPADPRWFGPNAPRIKGGFDFVGDSYNPDSTAPTYQPVPHPDPNPLDCEGHGSHVAGTAAGSGVTADGAMYSGPYDAATLSNPANFVVGPGVAPKADLYAVRIFGCLGPTELVLEGIDWAVDNDMDVINMSLGGVFGSKDDPTSAAATNAAKAGIIVVAAAGNDGPNPYIVSAPATGEGAIAVAANDPTPSFPAATISFTGAGGALSIPAINANGYALPPSRSYTIKVLTGANQLGCSVAAFGGPLPPDTIAVVNRGACARVAKAIFGQQAGAAAVVMVNDTAGFPPFEGQINSNPDTSESFLVTIPFLGVRGPATTSTSDGAKLRAASGLASVAAAAPLVNPAYKAFGDFSAGGPRNGDSHLKPDITAPGVSIISVLAASGNGAFGGSGTSQATPHVSGSGALARQAHPQWSVADIKAAIVHTGNPDGVAGYRTSRGGTGLVQPAGATATQVVARTGQEFATAVDFGFAELKRDFTRSKTITLRNNGSRDAIFNVTVTHATTGTPHTARLSRAAVRVPAHDGAEIGVTLSVPAATAGNSAAFREVAGLIEFTPASAHDNDGVTLRVPYYLVPRAQADVETSIGTLAGTNPSTLATVTNKRGAIDGSADFYSWGILDRRLGDDDAEDEDEGNNAGRPSNDVRAIGVQSFPFPSASNPTRRAIVFAVNGYNRWSNASTNEFDIYVDVDGDGIDDYVIIGADQGAVQTGTFNGIMGSFVFSLRSPRGTIAFLAAAPTDSSTALLPLVSTQLCLGATATLPAEPCLSVSNPRLTYHAVSFDLLTGGRKIVAGMAKYNAWTSAISDGTSVKVAPGASDASTIISVNSAEAAQTPALGVMVVNIDNKSGADEAQLIPINVK